MNTKEYCIIVFMNGRIPSTKFFLLACKCNNLENHEANFIEYARILWNYTKDSGTVKCQNLIPVTTEYL